VNAESIGLDVDALMNTYPVSNLLLNLIERDIDENHMDILDAISPQQRTKLVESLLDYISGSPLQTGDGNNLYLKQERAIIILADALYGSGVPVDRDALELASIISANAETRKMIVNALENKKRSGTVSVCATTFVII
jgi:hypothetical protein